MSEKDQIRKALKRQFATKQNLIEARPGQMGDGYGSVDVAGREHYVYVRVAGMIEEVFNNRVPAENDLLVTVGFDPAQPNLYQVLSTRTATPGGTTGGAVTGYAPAIRYEYMAAGGGQDPLWVQKRQFLPLRIGPYSGMLIQVYRDIVWTGTAFAAVNTQTVDLTAHIPATAGQAALVLITINTSGAVVATKGSEVDIADLGADDVPTVPAATREVLGAVRVYNGQTAVQEARSNTDIVDLRFSGWSASDVAVLGNHDHSGDAGDGGAFPLVNLTSTGASAGQVPAADGSGGIDWDTPVSSAYTTEATGGGNAAAALTTPTYDSSGEAVHPSMYDAGEGQTWNGHRYWMALTPYPNSDGALENPSLLCSDDGTTWAAPAGLTNPIIAAPGGADHNADPDIIVVDGTMYLYYLYNDIDVGAYLRVVSGITALAVQADSPANVLTGALNVMNSPAVIEDNGTYRMWYVNSTADPNTLHYRTSASPESGWSAEGNSTITGGPSGKDIWHLDVIRRGAQLHGFFLYVDSGTSSTNGTLYFATSTDNGQAWTVQTTAILSPGTAGAWDSLAIYRASAWHTTTGYDLYYSAIKSNGATVAWRIGKTTVALTETGVGDMYKADFDRDNDGVVDNAEMLGGIPAADFLTEAEHTALGNASPHHAPVTLSGGSDPALTLSGQELTLVLTGATGQYRQLLWEVSGGTFTFLIESTGNPIEGLMDLE